MTDAPFTPIEAAQRAVDRDLRLEGEDPHTACLEDAVHWVAVYSELLAFKESLLTTTDRSFASMQQDDARTDAMTDVVLLRAQADRYARRLHEWKDRLDVLQGSNGSLATGSDAIGARRMRSAR